VELLLQTMDLENFITAYRYGLRCERVRGFVMQIMVFIYLINSQLHKIHRVSDK